MLPTQNHSKNGDDYIKWRDTDMSQAERVYERGKALNEDLRRNIIQHIAELLFRNI